MEWELEGEHNGPTGILFKGLTQVHDMGLCRMGSAVVLLTTTPSPQKVGPLAGQVGADPAICVLAHPLPEGDCRTIEPTTSHRHHLQ